LKMSIHDWGSVEEKRNFVDLNKFFDSILTDTKAML